MKRTSPKAAARQERSAAAKRTLLLISERCDWCYRRTELTIHHHAGRSGDLIDDLRFLLLLCPLCHAAIEERVLGHDGLAIGLALLRHLGRGTVNEYWQATGQNRPSHELVEHWADRLHLNQFRGAM